MPARLRLALPIVVGIALVTGCKKKNQDEAPAANPPTEPPVAVPPIEVDGKALDRCIKGIAAAQDAQPEEQIPLLMKGCAAAQPGFARLASAGAAERPELFIAATDIACNEKTRKRLSEHRDRWLGHAVDACGADYYGLSKQQQGWMSVEWFVIHRVGRYLSALRPHVPAGQVSAMDAALAEDRWSLPVPAQLAGEYQVPTVANLQLVGKTLGWVVLTKKAIRLATPPYGTITKNGAQVVTDKGAFPGVVVAPDQLRSMLLDDDEGDDEGRGHNAPPTKGWTHPHAPVIVADKSVSSVRLSEVVGALGGMGARLAVVGRDPYRLATLPAGLRVARAKELGAQPMVIEMTPDALRIHFGKTREEVPEIDGDYDWIKLGLVVSTARKLGFRRAAIGARPWVTVEHVANAANLLSQANFEIALTPKGADVAGIARSAPAPAASGKVDLGGVEATGAMEASVVHRYVSQHRGRIRHCYDTHLKVDANAAGRVTVSFTIAPDGGVLGARASGFVASVNTCVREVIESIRFPRPKKGSVLVRYPFEFRKSS